MCGITGYYAYGAQLVTYPIGSALSLMAHRGPDDRGLVHILPNGAMVEHDATSDNITVEPKSLVLGQVRFSLVDVTPAGHQPFVTEDGRITLTFNGEIYNYIELKNELVKEGVVFKTNSDAEVLAQGYAHWGVDCFSKFNGFWAVAIFDKRENKILISRDRIGKAPLYILRNSGSLLWSSEIKSLLSMVPEEKTNIRDQSVYHFANWLKKDYGHHTFYKNITTFPSASYGWIDANGEIDIHQYWHLPTERNTNDDISVDEAIEEFRYLLSDAVRIRLRADAPVALQLSGGLDSSALVASAADFSDKISAYTIKYGYGEQDEEPYARMVADHYKSSVNYIVITPTESNIFSKLPDYTKLMDEPYHSPNQLSSHLIWQNMAEHGFRAVLYGAGGDEVFAGYTSEYYPPYLRGKLKRMEVNGFFTDFLQCSEYSEPAKVSDYAKMLAKLVPGISRKSTHGRLSFIDRKKNPLSMNGFHAETPRPPNNLNELLCQNMADWKLNYWLRIDNQNSMGTPIELRSPFLDHRVIEFAFTLPINFLIRDGWMKWIIRKAMEDKLPADIIWRRKKMGFPFPIKEWLQKNKQNLISSLQDAECPYVNADQFARQYDYLNQRDAEYLWGLVSLLLWWKHSVHR